MLAQEPRTKESVMERLVGGGLLEELGGRLATSEPAEDARSWLDETPLSGSLQRSKEKKGGKGRLTTIQPFSI